MPAVGVEVARAGIDGEVEVVKELSAGVGVLDPVELGVTEVEALAPPGFGVGVSMGEVVRVLPLPPSPPPPPPVFRDTEAAGLAVLEGVEMGERDEERVPPPPPVETLGQGVKEGEEEEEGVGVKALGVGVPPTVEVTLVV